MPSDYGGDAYDISNLSDAELRDVVIDHLRDQPNLDVDDIDVIVRVGVVTLSGRVGTDAEVQVASQILDDVLGLDDFSNDLVVDELRRGQEPEAGDEVKGGETDSERAIADPASQHSDTADHLVEDIETATFGTEDVGTAVRDATSYSPPDGPVADGYGSREDH